MGHPDCGCRLPKTGQLMITDEKKRAAGLPQHQHVNSNSDTTITTTTITTTTITILCFCLNGHCYSLAG